MEEAARERSKSLFGNRYMLEICVTLGTTRGRVTLSDLVEANDVSSASLYVGPVKRLVMLGLLVPAPKDGDDHRQRWYSPAKTALWKAAAEVRRGVT